MGYKRGAASFYIVAFSTLILVVIATSFAMIIASEVARTSNDDLSQSAYDSALAGTEDAKVAFSNYRRCAEAGATEEKGSEFCKKVMWWMHHPDCYMVGHILGKIPANVEYGEQQAEVVIGGVTKSGADGETTTNQAYTCVKIDTDLNDYRATLNRTTKIRTFRGSVGNEDSPINNANKIRLSWYSTRNDSILRMNTFNTNSNKVIFPQLSLANITTPPIVELQLVQTSQQFTMDQFDQYDTNKTNRATLYLVPTDNKEKAANTQSGGNYIGTWNDSIKRNKIESTSVAATNNRTVNHKAFLVNCNNDPNQETNGFQCSVDIMLPDPIGLGPRNNNTFMISVALPYQQPDTDFAVEIFCPESSAAACGGVVDTGEKDGSGQAKATIANTQISIDSTGRANDLYRRVETRIETADTTFGAGYPYYALQVLGPGGFSKEMRVENEVPFKF